MIKQLIAGHALRRSARFLPGGWITMLALSPTGRKVVRGGWNYLQKQQRQRSGRPPMPRD